MHATKQARTLFIEHDPFYGKSIINVLLPDLLGEELCWPKLDTLIVVRIGETELEPMIELAACYLKKSLKLRMPEKLEQSLKETRSLSSTPCSNKLLLLIHYQKLKTRPFSHQFGRLQVIHGTSTTTIHSGFISHNLLGFKRKYVRSRCSEQDRIYLGFILLLD